MADNGQETAKRVRRGRGPGRPFPPGVSGNAGGRPKGIPNFSILRMVADALNDKITRAEAISRLQEAMKNRKTVLQSLEFAARMNREIGLGSEDRPPGITITLSPTSSRARSSDSISGRPNRGEYEEHSPTSATGTGWERTPWRGTPRAVWEALKKT
jgi:hypothetical protein